MTTQAPCVGSGRVSKARVSSKAVLGKSRGYTPLRCRNLIPPDGASYEGSVVGPSASVRVLSADPPIGHNKASGRLSPDRGSGVGLRRRGTCVSCQVQSSWQRSSWQQKETAHRPEQVSGLSLLEEPCGGKRTSPCKAGCLMCFAPEQRPHSDTEASPVDIRFAPEQRPYEWRRLLRPIFQQIRARSCFKCCRGLASPPAFHPTAFPFFRRQVMAQGSSAHTHTRAIWSHPPTHPPPTHHPPTTHPPGGREPSLVSGSVGDGAPFLGFSS